jgi:hypothetical protein
MTIRPRFLATSVTVSLVAGCLLLGGCLDRRLKPLNPCLVSGVVATVSVTNIDKVDLLFMVDNSGSMKEEQEALREEFPNLIRVLTTGDRDGDNMMDFPPARDLHLGVVSSDMGLVGIEPGAANNLRCPGVGDDGVLLHAPSPDIQGCMTAYPTFLTYQASVNQPAQTASDFACIASLGTTGCGFEQQLEAPLKALWQPSTDAMGLPTEPPIGGPFLSDPSGTGKFGHGDRENATFIRNDPKQGLSLIAIIIVSDEEDCSSKDTRHFVPFQDLPADSPIRGQRYAEHPNLRCFENKQNLFSIDRYVTGFKALRPGNENLVIFAGIVGVPPELVQPDRVAAVDFTNDTQRTAFYDSILNDTRMVEVPDENMVMAGAGAGNLRPSCQSSGSTAYPPRRIVEVARAFGENSVIQSICQDDFGPALDAIIAVIARQLGAVCLPRTLVRNSDGKVGCNVVWELPPPAEAQELVPTQCGAPGYEFLLDPGSDRERTNDKGGAICRVAQLAVTGTGAARKEVPTLTDGVMYERGWYYDDFSEDVLTQCTGSSKQRIAFSKNAPPPTGVTVSLECLNETQTLTNTRVDLKPNIQQPSVGDPCRDVMRNSQTLTGDAACEVQLLAPTAASPDGIDRSMFCHPELNVCVLACNTTANCPPAWVCDERETTTSRSGNNRKICVNPTCGDLK